MFHPSRGRARPRRRGRILGRGRARQAGADRVRLAVRAAPARGQPAALPAADPRAEAVLRRPRRCTVLLLDDLTSPSHDLQVQSIAHGVLLLEQLVPRYGAERRRLQRDQVPRRRVSRRLPRLRHPAAAASRSFRAWSPPSTGQTSSREQHRQRHRGARRAARRRHRARHQHADRRRRRHRQVDARRAVRGARRRARRARGDVHLRRERQHAAQPLRTAWASTWSEHADDGRVAIQQVDPAELSPGEFAHAHPREPSRSSERQHRRDRQPERLPQRHARGAVSHRPAARAADLPRPARASRRS